MSGTCERESGHTALTPPTLPAPTRRPVLVHPISAVERCSHACSFGNAEVELEHNQRELRHPIA
jgi:hypothetical protein